MAKVVVVFNALSVITLLPWGYMDSALTNSNYRSQPNISGGARLLGQWFLWLLYVVRQYSRFTVKDKVCQYARGILQIRERKRRPNRKF